MFWLSLMVLPSKAPYSLLDNLAIAVFTFELQILKLAFNIITNLMSSTFSPDRKSV